MPEEPTELTNYTRQELIKYIRELEEELEIYKDIAESCECGN